MEIEGITLDSAKKIVELEAKCDRLEVEKTRLIGEVMGFKANEESMKDKYKKLKDGCVKMQKEFDSEKSNWAEETIKIGNECSQVMLEKTMIDIDLKAAEAEVGQLKSLLEKRDGPVTNLLVKIKGLERQNSKLESNLEAAKMRSQELEKTLLDLKSLFEEEDDSIIVRARGKRKKIREELAIESSGKSFEAERIGVNNALEDEKKEMRKKIAALEAVMEAAEIDKRVMEEEHKKKLLELSQRIKVLEGEKTEMEAKLIQANKDRREEIKRISVEKIAVEAEKRALKDESEKEVLEQARRIEVLEWEIKEMEVEVSEGKRILNEMAEIDKLIMEKSIQAERIEELSDTLEDEKKRMEVVREEIKEFLGSFDTFVVETDKKVSGLDHSIEVLEKEKRELIAAFQRILNDKGTLKEKYEKKNWELVSRIEVLEREKKEMEEEACVAMRDALKDKDDKIEEITRILKEQYDKKILEFVLRVDILENEMEVKKAPTHQAQNQGCSVSNHVGIKRSESESVWKTAENMLSAFTNDAELCMRSICALYRKHKSLGRWMDCLTSSILNNGFMPPYEERGTALGEFLTRGDPKGMLKMSLAEFEQADPCGLENCRLITKHHYKELFEIYKSNIDPLFLSGDG